MTLGVRRPTMADPPGGCSTSPASERPAYGPNCQTPVGHAAMVQWWEEVTFLHWPFEPGAVQRLLPPQLAVETFDDMAWVGLVPFYLKVGLPGLPSVPWLSRFPETNVRTYVRSADGASGLWFFSLVTIPSLSKPPARGCPCDTPRPRRVRAAGPPVYESTG